MSLTIDFLGEKYEVQEFNDTHILPCLKLLAEGLNDIQAQSRAGMAIKEIIIPDIPNEIVDINSKGIYIIRLDSEDLNTLLMQILTCHYQFSIERAKQKGKSQDFINDLQEKLENTKEVTKLTSTYATLKHTIHLVADVENSDEEQKNPDSNELKQGEGQDKNAAEIKALQDRLKNLQG